MNKKKVLVLNPMKVFGLDLDYFNPYGGFGKKQGYEIIQDEIEKHQKMYECKPELLVFSVKGCTFEGIPMNNEVPNKSILAKLDNYY